MLGFPRISRFCRNYKIKSSLYVALQPLLSFSESPVKIGSAVPEIRPDKQKNKQTDKYHKIICLFVNSYIMHLKKHIYLKSNLKVCLYYYGNIFKADIFRMLQAVLLQNSNFVMSFSTYIN